MYDPLDLLHRIDEHTAPILVGFAMAMVFQTIAMVTAVRLTAREHWISIPLPCTFLWFAHDLGAVGRFDDWFGTYDHWFLKLFWVGLLSALLLELVFFAQAIRYGRKEYLPGGTQTQWTALVVAGAAATVVGWEFLKVVFDDPLYQAGAALTLFVLPMFTTAQLLRRASAVAQTPLIYGSFATMVVLWWGVTVGYYGDRFGSWQYILTGVVAFVMLVGVTAAITRMRQRPDMTEAAKVPGSTPANDRSLLG